MNKHLPNTTTYFQVFPQGDGWIFQTFNRDPDGKRINISHPWQFFADRDDCRSAALNCGYFERGREETK